MAFTVPVTLSQTGLVSPNSTVSRTNSIDQEIVTQLQVVAPTGTTAINLNILDVTKVNLLAINTTDTISFKFDYTGNNGWKYYVKDIVVLYNDSLRIYNNSISSTSGEMKTMYVTNNNASSVTVNIVIVTSND